MKPDRYVLGFAFDNNGRVLLIRKKKPKWQEGLLNGIGGHVEPNELPLAAMNRECFEETGLSLGWVQKGVLEGSNNDGKPFICHVFYSWYNHLHLFQQPTDEEPELCYIHKLKQGETLHNTLFLIALGISGDNFNFFRVQY